jgi:YfiH family protein
MTSPVLHPDWPAPERVRAAVTTRLGGVSSGGFAELNLAAHVGDDPSHVERNRRRLRESLALPADPAWLAQVHGRDIVDLDRGAANPSADGAVTRRPGVVCAVMTADCVPVLLAEPQGLVVGAAHAGWRGLAAGVIGAAVAAMRTPTERLLAWIGPAICAQHYEVGQEVCDALIGASPGAQRALTRNAGGRWQADLVALTRMILADCGVTRIYGGGVCTFGDEARFFSHRREAPCGRMAALIWLDDVTGRADGA